jgi:vacuolar-type H+-ATPase subunit E/Vma4
MANQSTPFRNKEETRQMGTTPIGEKAREAASSMTDKGKELASSATHTVQDAASTAAQRAKEFASSASQSASDVASNVGHRVEDATTSVGSGMRNLAGTLREKMPHEGMLGSASSAVADSLDRGGRYIEEEGLQGIASDVTDLVRRYPIPALLIGLGLGYLIARSLRS